MTPFVKKAIQDMIDVVMNTSNAAALAAPQIGYDLRIFVNLVSKEKDEDGYLIYLDEPEVYINPVITKTYRRRWVEAESCLSLPKLQGRVQRPYEIDIEYTNLAGERILSKKEKDWRARCLQHEYDHLNGVMYPDLMTKEDYALLEPSLVKLERKTKEKMNESVSPKDFLI